MDKCPIKICILISNFKIFLIFKKIVIAHKTTKVSNQFKLNHIKFTEQIIVITSFTFMIIYKKKF